MAVSNKYGEIVHVFNIRGGDWENTVSSMWTGETECRKSSGEDCDKGSFFFCTLSSFHPQRSRVATEIDAPPTNAAVHKSWRVVLYESENNDIK